MQIGASAAYTYAFRGTRIELEDYVESIRSLGGLGIRCFDLEVLKPEHISIYSSPKNIDTLKRACRENGVNIVGFTAWACLKWLHSRDPKDHQQAFALFHKIAAIAAELGAAYIHLGSDMVGEYIVSRDDTYETAPAVEVTIPRNTGYPEIMAEYATNLRELARIAANYGLRFALEPRANSLVCTVDSFQNIAREVDHPNLFCCLDVTHATYHREDIHIAIEKLGPRLLVLHLCDCISGRLSHLPLGKGVVNISSILEALNKVHFDGFVMLEIYEGGNDPKTVVDQWYRDALQLVLSKKTIFV